MAKASGKHIFYGLLRNSARTRNRIYRRGLLTGPTKVPNSQPVDEEWRLRFKRTRGRGKQPQLRLIDAINRFCTTFLEPTKPAKIFRALRNQYYRIAEVLGPNTLIHEITKADLTCYRDHILESGYKPASANRYISAMNALLSTCRDNWLVVDEVPHISNIKMKRDVYRYLTDGQEQRLLSRCGKYLRQLIEFIVNTGARKGEALNLTWNDVFIDGVPRGWVRFTHTKNGQPHSVPLPNHIRDMLSEMRLERPEHLECVFWHVPSRDCRDRSGNLIAQKGVASPYFWPDRDFRKARQEAGLPGFRIHDLRHTYASRLVMKGVSLIFINKLLNHADLEQTAHYAHFSVDYLSNSVSVLDRFDGAPRSPQTEKRLVDYAGLL